MDKAEVEQEEELNEWVFIQTSSKPLPIDASTSQNSPILQPCHHRENPPEDNDDDDDDDDDDGGDDDDDDDDVTIVGEESESSSTVELTFPWRVIETVKKRLIKNSVLFFRSVERVRCNYVTHRRVFWSLTFIAGLSLVSSLVYVKFVRWWRQLQEEKLRFLFVLLREKDQKIKELMAEIGRLNELLSSRRKVRVVRIV